MSAACTVPSAVTSVTATAGSNQATISWVAGSKGSSALTAYVVREISGGNAGQSQANNGSATSLVMTGLAGGVAAEFSVVAENSCGAGPAADSTAATPTGTSTTYASTVISDHPSVYYRLAEASGTVMADSSGGKHDGTYDSETALGQPGALLTNPTSPSASPGSDGNGIGSSPAALPQFADSRTVTAWVNITEANAAYNPLLVGWGTEESDQAFIVGIGPSAITVDGYSDYHSIQTSHPVGDGNWHFIAVTYNGSLISAYLDGQLQGTAQFSSSLATFGSGLQLGSYAFGYSGFTGNMQDVAVYPSALTAAQLSAQYAAAGYAVPSVPPVAHAAAGGANAAQISWGDASNPAEPTLSYVVTAVNGPDAGMSVSAPGSATAVRMNGLAAGATQFTVTAEDLSGAGPAATTNSYTVPGAATTYASTVSSGTPDVFYRLGDGSPAVMTDSSGNGATGAYDSTVTLGSPGPLVGDATPAATVGSDGDIGVAGGSLPLYNSPRTAEAWFSTTSADDSQYQALLAWGSTNTDQGFTVGETPDAIWVDGSYDAHSVATPYPINDGNWHFVAVTSNGSSFTVYLDGLAIGSGNFAQQLDTLPTAPTAIGPPGGLYLGQGISPDEGPLSPMNQGSLADVAIFPTALTSAQIAAQFTASGHARPTAPGSVTATAGANDATVTWTAASAPGSAVTSYLVTALKNGTTAANAVAVSGTAKSAVLTGLAAGTAYGFEVQARDSYGAGTATAAATTVTPTGNKTTYVSTVLGTAPSLFYRLGDSTANLMADSSGHGQNGAYLAGAVALGQSGPIVGDASASAQVVGDSGIASANVPLPLSNSARSVVAWFKETSSDGTESLVSWGQPGTDQAFQLMVSGAQGIGVDGFDDIHTVTTPYPIDDGYWHQIAVTYNGTAFSLYLDGELVGTGDFSEPLDTLTSPLSLGGDPDLGYEGPIGANLADVSVYGSALTAAQLAAQFTASGHTRPAAPAGLAAQAGANQATVTWTAGPSTVQTYLVTALAGGTTAGNSIAVPGTATSAVIGGLAGGTSYAFRVTGINNYGLGTAAVTSQVTPTGSASSYSGTVLADQPSAYYRLTDSSATVAADSSASQVTGVYQSGSYTAGATGPIQGDPGTGISLSDGYTAVDASANVPLYNSPRTVEAWFSIPAGATPAGNIVGWGQDNTDQAFNCGISADAITVDGGIDAHQFATPYPVNDGHWHQLAVTYNGSTITVYLDGQQIGTGQFDGTLDTLPGQLNLGAGVYGFDGPGDGVNLAQVSIYPAALSAARIAAHFAAAGYAVPTAPGSVTALAGSNQATIGWSAASAPGTSVTSYLVTAYSGTTARNSLAVPGTASSAVITGLAAGVKYTFRVVARDPYGAGPAGTSPAVTPTGSTSTYASTVLADAPAAFYRLADSTTGMMADSSGKGAEGFYASGVTVGVAGSVGDDSATAASTSEGPIGTADPVLPDEQQARTVTAWVQTTYTGEQDVAGWGSTAEASEGFSVGFDQNDIYVDEYGDVLDFTTTATITNGDWQFIVVTATGTSATAYLNGTSLGTQKFPVTLDTAPGQPLIIGSDVTSSYGLSGTMDDLAIFPSVLSATQISALYTAADVTAARKVPHSLPLATPAPHRRARARGGRTRA